MELEDIIDPLWDYIEIWIVNIQVVVNHIKPLRYEPTVPLGYNTNEPSTNDALSTSALHLHKKTANHDELDG